MALGPGTRLGVYEIVSLLGAGGMGEVYRAKDTKLGREVALKILPATFTNDPDRVARFRREAQVLASLNHPHIAQIHGFEDSEETQFLVLELVNGESLDTRIARGRIPVDDALGIAMQIAQALEAAHEKGIIHRDLKPANIALTRDGNVKVLDFGLAKTTDQASDTSLDTTNSPTISSPVMMTGVRAILGTAAYMSPEQAKGRPADKRSDVWAFGCVLFEMLSGRKAFPATSVSEHIVAVLECEPNWGELPRAVPAHVRRALRWCLTKDIKRRVHDIADLRLDLDELDDVVPRAAPAHSPRWQAVAVAAAVVIGIAAGMLYARRSQRPAVRVTRSIIALPPQTTLSSDLGAVAISPDGTFIVFAADAGDGSRLYLRALDARTPTPMAGTEGAEYPFFSPDGRWVAFWDHSTLKKIALGGGAPQVICVAGGYTSFVMRTATWDATGVIFFSNNSGSGLWRVADSGGTPQVLTTPNRNGHEKSHRLRDVLPGAKALILTVGTADIASFDDARIEALTLSTGARRVLVEGGMQGRYLATGHLVYARAGSLLAVPFDIERLQVTGTPAVVAEDVFTDPDNGYANFAVSRDGSLAFAPGGVRAHRNTLVWVDRAGHSELVTDVRKPFENVRLSPGGKFIATNVDQATAEIWLYDLARRTFSRLAYGWDNNFPVWSPDGTRVTFNSNRLTPGAWNLFHQSADGSDVAERLTSDGSASQIPESWAPDGRSLVFTQQAAATADRDLWIRLLADPRPRPLVKTTASESDARISPDGRWVAYQSNQSGRFEVYVQRFPDAARKWQVSVGGGMFPIWAPSGDELFYRNGADVLAADISTSDAALQVGIPKRLFSGPYLHGSGSYDVGRDGRFVMIRPDSQSISKLELVQNWFEELKARMPAK